MTELTRDQIVAALKEANGSKSAAARALGIARHDLRARMRTLRVRAPARERLDVPLKSWISAALDGRLRRVVKRRKLKITRVIRDAVAREVERLEQGGPRGR